MYNRNKTSARPRQRSEYEDNISYGAQGAPSTEGEVKCGLSALALRNLPKSAYSVQADPYSAALPGSEPYPILNPFNRRVGGMYGGLKNIDGGNVQQYANSQRSKMLHYFDFIRCRVGVNYRYLPAQIPTGASASGHYPGKALIDEQRRSISEATSVLQSTTFTQMAIFQYAVATDMPMGSATSQGTYTPTDGAKNPIPYYTNLTDVIFASLRYYQVFWQKLAAFFTAHNSFRLKMGTMIRSSWNRETPNLNALFGLFKKKSFLSLIDSLAMAMPGEYIDVDFIQQVNQLFAMPSRRSNALTDPVLELGVDVNQSPNFYLLMIDPEDSTKVMQEPIFSSNTDLVKTYAPGGTKSFDDAVNECIDLFSAQDTMKWARSTTTTAGSDTTRYNNVKWRTDIIQLCVTTFKTLFNDVREVLDTVSRTGLVTWRKGYRPSIVKDTDAALFQNKIVDDVFKMMFSGATEVELNPDTKRWRTFSIWNMYDGIPMYDTMSGGAFLTFSLKTVNAGSDQDNIQDYLPVGLTPYRKETTSNMTGLATNRLGTEISFSPAAVTMNNNPVFDRLVPLDSQGAEQIRLATCEATDVHDVSVLYKELATVFGACAVTYDDKSEYALDPDVVAIYQIEIEDITNEAINYARVYGPFRGAISALPTIGFLGTVGS